MKEGTGEQRKVGLTGEVMGGHVMINTIEDTMETEEIVMIGPDRIGAIDRRIGAIDRHPEIVTTGRTVNQTVGEEIDR